MLKVIIKQAYRASLYAPLKWLEREVRSSIFFLLSLCFRHFNPFKVFGVPSKVVSITSKVVYPSAQVIRIPPKTLEEKIPDTFSTLTDTTKQGTITSISNGIATESAAHLTHRGELIQEFTQHFACKNLNKHRLFNFRMNRFPPQISFYDSTVLSLVADGHWNYYHWLFDVLPKIHLARISGVNFEAVYAKYSKAFQKQSLSQLGISAQTTINADRFPIISAKSLILTSFPCFGPTPKWVIAFLQKNFLPKKQRLDLPKKIFISRANADYRRILNQEALETALNKEGFVTLELEKLSLAEQAAHFNSAKCIIAPHGAGLANCVFCVPQTSVIEIFPPRFTCSCYWALGNACNLKYQFVLGKNDPTTYNAECPGYDHLIADIPKIMKTFCFA